MRYLATDSGSVAVARWVDNLLFSSRAMESAQMALGTFTHGLHEMGMLWKASSVQWASETARTQETRGRPQRATRTIGTTAHLTTGRTLTRERR